MKALILFLSLLSSLSHALADPRRPLNEAELLYWLGNMTSHHHYRMDEMPPATGLPLETIAKADESPVTVADFCRLQQHARQHRQRSKATGKRGGRNPARRFRLVTLWYDILNRCQQ